MATNLEDLLATGDSDDEVEEDVNVDGIDLEQLLDMKDDDDEDGTGRSSMRYSISSVSSKSAPSKLQELFGAVSETVGSVAPSISSHTSAFHSIRKANDKADSDDDDVAIEERKQIDALLEPDTPDAVNEDNAAVSAASVADSLVIAADYSTLHLEDDHTSISTSAPVVDTRQSFISLNAVMPTHMKECPTLKLAEVREQRALHYGERSAMSALQLRKSAATSGSSSNSSSASLMMLDEMNAITKQLKRNGDYQQHGPGTATAMVVGPKMTAVGTVKGYALIFDHKQEIRRVLTAPSPTRGSSMAVTSLDSLSEGSMVITGHRSGDILFWDCAKQQVLRQIRDPSGGDVLKVFFLPNVGCLDYKCNYSLTDSESFHAIALTDNSVVNRFKLSKSILTSWHIEVDCLLDGTVGRILALSMLGPVSEKLVANPVARYVSSPSNVAEYSDIRNYPSICQFFAFSYYDQTHIVQILPELKVLHKWEVKNAPLEDDQESTEVLDWTWLYLTAKEPEPENLDINRHDAKKEQVAVGVWTPVISRARKNRLELLAMRIMIGAREAKPVAPTTRRGSLLAFASTFAVTSEDLPSLKFDFQPIGEVVLDCGPIVSLKWISASHVVAFTTKEILLLDATLTLLEKMSLFPPIVEAFKPATNAMDIVPQFATYNKEIFVLLSMAMVRVLIKSPFDSAESFITSGRWLEGLALIVENIQKSPSLLLYEEENIRKYILRYASLAVKRSLAADSNTGSTASRNLHSTKNHFHLVASVCVEYCVATKNLSLLFYEILEIFRGESHQSTLLEALEPFILSRTITSLPPAVIADFLSAAVTSDKMRTIERCVAYFDPMTLDINFVTKFLFDQKMFSTFLYVYAYGLADFPSAFQLVFQYIMSQRGMIDREGRWKNLDVLGGEDDSSLASGDAAGSEITDLGYKLLLFLLYTFEDKIFPRGDMEPQSYETVFGLLELLTSAHLIPLPGISNLSSMASVFFSDNAELVTRMKYPILMFFTKLDASALMFCLVKGIERINRMIESSDTASSPAKSGHKNMVEHQLAHLLYEIFAFSRLVDEEQEQASFQLTYKISMEHLFFQQFHAMISCLTCPLPMDLMQQMLSHSAKQPPQQHHHDEQLFVQLVEKQGRYLSHVHSSTHGWQELHRVLTGHNFFIAALALKPTFSSSVSANQHQQFIQMCKDLLSNGVRYYVELAHQLMHREHRYEGWDSVFSFIHLQYQHLDSFTAATSEGELDSVREYFRLQVIQVILEIAGIDLKQTIAVIIQYLLPSLHDLVEVSKTDPRAQYNLLKALLEEWKSAHPGVNIASEYLQISDLLTYLRLTAKYDPESFLSFFMEYEEYCPVDDCLDVAKEFHISDAIAYILEKTGDVSQALQILLKDVSAKIRQGRREIDAQLRNEAKDLRMQQTSSSSAANVGPGYPNKHWLTPLLPRAGRRGSVNKTHSSMSTSSNEIYQLVEALLRLPACKSLRHLVDRTSDLCERQSHNISDDHANVENLWHQTLDHLLDERCKSFYVDNTFVFFFSKILCISL